MDILKKYETLAKLLNRKPNLNEFIERLEKNELFSFLELLLMEDNEVLIKIFNSYKNFDRDEVAFHSLINLPYFLIEKISDMYDIIFNRSLQNFYGDKSENVIHNIIAFSSYGDIGLSNEYLNKTIYDKNIAPQIRMNLLTILRERKESSYLDNYYSTYSINDDPFLLPFIFSHIYYIDKNLIISFIGKLNEIKIDTPNDHIQEMFLTVLYDIIKSEWRNRDSENIDYLKELTNMPRFEWLNNIFSQILSFEEFEDLQLLLRIDAINDLFKTNVENLTKDDFSYLKEIINRKPDTIALIYSDLRELLQHCDILKPDQEYKNISQQLTIYHSNSQIEEAIHNELEKDLYV